MGKINPFTPEQIEVLRQNPYTHSITPGKIVYTVAFKKFFYEQTKIPGMTTKKIYLKAGYNPEWFTRAALDSMRHLILKEAASPEGFKPPKGLSEAEKTELFRKQDLSKKSTQAAIKQLQERIVHLEHQVEFLKKTAKISSKTQKK